MSKARIAIAWIVTTALLGSAAGISTAVVAGAAPTLFTANAEVHVRTGPSTTNTILMTLKKGAVVEGNGSAADGWRPITFESGRAWVYAQYVTQTASNSTPVTVGLAGKKPTTANVNLRTAPTLTSEILKVIKKGVTVDVSGRRSGDFTEVTVDGAVRWLYSKYVAGVPTPTDPTTPPPPDTLAKVITTTTLALRSSASANAATLGDAKPNTEVGLTGRHTASYSEIVIGAQFAWVLTGYLKAAPSGPTVTLPVSLGLRYIRATDVNVRQKSDAESTKLATLAHGTVLQMTGPKVNKYTQIIFNGGLGWVATEYLSITKPAETLGSTSLDKLNAYGKAAVLVVRDRYPEIRTIHGWRSSSAYSSDHPNGRAIDIMIPSYKSNKALGDKIAQYFIDNHKALHVKYVIWRQRNYTITRGRWVHMPDRGGDTANHYDHVHVSFTG